jgi:hypothetical protein
LDIICIGYSAALQSFFGWITELNRGFRIISRIATKPGIALAIG